MQGIRAARETQLESTKLALLRGKGWGYLRYLHFRDFVVKRKEYVKTIGIVGAGRGVAELALALEFPELEFYLTDIVIPGNGISPGRPSYFDTMNKTMHWNVRNIRFGVWDLLKPAPMKFDVVASTEVLEHIGEAARAFEAKVAAARRAVYCLVPYATRKQNSDAELRLKAYLTHEHFVCGFEPDFFSGFGERMEFAGTYWIRHGGRLRSRLANMTPEQIALQANALHASAKEDLMSALPDTEPCFGMKVSLDKS